jgi:autotransporter adhesin
LNGARASGFTSTAVGVASQATGGGSSAFGLGSNATADNSSAYGEFSTASGVASLALGHSAVASMHQAVAIGNGSIADVQNTISVGRTGHERRIVNVAPANHPTDAVNLAQVKALIANPAASAPVAQVSVAPAGTADAIDDLRRELLDLRALVNRQQQRISQLESHHVAAAPAK